ncbi:hypothetical protein OZX69_03985 [Lactobacillus sp. ESL0731]|uniref:hypothetical protein n=1 Tax=unclassified Lactobacillus TaxID=2620435 RepID=UPI0023F7EB8B|nr:MULTISPECIES: hypothetical protein [unclassified Lactobacillus]WEV51868.1 hypothetical protein OZX63_03980 [Lactobacillus sp. ESL0700]WEV62999.1 hypothetical protein OZX69_03985 [Lactobacillus sp. ESL0731]
MKTTKLVVGILQMVFAAIILFQSFMVGMANIVATGGAKNAALGTLTALLYVVSGTIYIVTRKDPKIIGDAISLIIMALTWVLDLNFHGDFTDLSFYGWIAIIIGLIFFLWHVVVLTQDNDHITINNKKNTKVDPKIYEKTNSENNVKSNTSNNSKKEINIYKYLAIGSGIIIIVFLGFFVFSKIKFTKPTSSNQTSSNQTSSLVKNNTVTELKTVTLNAGIYKVGRDIAPGRYKITIVKGSGNISSDNESNDEEINAIIGKDYDDDQVTSYTVDLVKKEKIELDDIEETKFTPITNRQYKTSLSAGSWEVGKDIKPGRYTIVATKGSGNISSDGSNDDDDINEILGTTVDKDDDQITKFTATLTKGEILNTDLQGIELIAK